MNKRVRDALRKIPKFHLISWRRNFVETHNTHSVSGESPETPRKLCVYTKFPNQEIKWNFAILRSAVLPKVVNIRSVHGNEMSIKCNNIKSYSSINCLAACSAAFLLPSLDLQPCHKNTSPCAQRSNTKLDLDLKLSQTGGTCNKQASDSSSFRTQ